MQKYSGFSLFNEIRRYRELLEIPSLTIVRATSAAAIKPFITTSTRKKKKVFVG